jgi:Ca2+-binding RTX toxin-like protein
MGRRAILLLSAMVTMVLVAAGVALAALFVGTIGDDPSCAATTGDDEIAMGPGNDTCSALAGNDQVSGDSGNDTLFGNPGNDQVFGDSGDDTLHGNLDNDQVYGGTGNDQLFGDFGTDFLNSVDNVSGNDTVNGGNGIDRCVVDEGDIVSECDQRVTRVPVL